MVFPRILRLRIGLVPTQNLRYDSKLVVPSLENATKMLDRDSQFYLEQLETKLPNESEVGKALGKDLTAKIKEDLEVKLGEIQSTPSAMVKELNKLEMKKYLGSFLIFTTLFFMSFPQVELTNLSFTLTLIREFLGPSPSAFSGKKIQNHRW